MSRIQKLETIYKEPLEHKDVKQISNFIQSILDADITKGKYARFLIEAFLNDKFLEEDLIGGFDSIVGQAIFLFHKHKHKLPVHERSVYSLDKETGEALYQSPGDLWNSVKQFQDELSGKELKREEQERIYRETEFIYTDEETGFQIVSPLTEDSAKWWGKGTRWCTSAEKNNMFKNYAKDAPLFILLMPDKRKLQLWNNGNKIQFMDEADNEIKLEYIEQHWSVLEPVCLWLNNLRLVPEKFITPKLCKLAVKQNGYALRFVPAHLKTPEVCQMAVQQDGKSLEYVPEKYKDEKLCQMAIQNNGWALRFVPIKLRTQELCSLAVINNGDAILYVPKEFRTKELCEIAVKQNGHALSHVPDKYTTKELCEIAVQNNIYALEFVPKEFRTLEIYKLAVKQDGYAIQYVPDEYKTKELYELTVKQNGEILAYIPEEYKTKELCELAVKENGKALSFVPDELITPELCELAVKQDGMSLRCIPKEYITYEICELAVQENSKAFPFIIDEFKDGLKHYVIDEVFELPIEKYQKTFQEIKTFFPTKDISLSYHHL